MKTFNSILYILLAFIFGTYVSFAQMTIVNGASFDAGHPMAPGSFASIFGDNLCDHTVAADWIAPGELPASLGGCSAMVNGTPAMLHYVSPDQINFIVPQNLGSGMASVAVNTGSQMMNGAMMIGPAGPGLFSMNGMGTGPGAILHGSTWRPGPFSVTTNGQPTVVSMFVTGIDPAVKPVVSVGGIPVEVIYHGNAPGYAGLQQINMMLPPGLAGVGHVPVSITSNGHTSNLIFMNILPTTAMMQGMPGWGPAMMVLENMPRDHELSSLAVNPANNTALVTDEHEDVVRVISLDSKTTVATITLPQGSGAHAIAVNQAGTLAAVALPHNDSVALVDLTLNEVITVTATGYYPWFVAFSGEDLLVANAASDTVSVIDTNTGLVTRTIAVGHGPAGIAVGEGIAIVANTQAGSLSLIDLSTFATTAVALPAGLHPYQAAISKATNTAIVTTPMSSGFLLLDLATEEITQVRTEAWNALGPGAVATNENLAFIANQMTSSVAVVDLMTGLIVETFPVDHGPRALAVNPDKSELLVLAQGTGTLDVVDLNGYALTARINAGATDRSGAWLLPRIFSLAPASAAKGTSFLLTIEGSNLQDATGLIFELAGPGYGMHHTGPGAGDPNIRVANVDVTTDGARMTAMVEILASAATGTRVIRLETDRGQIMGPMSNSIFRVTE